MSYIDCVRAADIIVIVTDKGIELSKVSNSAGAAVRLLQQSPNILVIDQRGPKKLWSFTSGDFRKPTYRQTWKVKNEPKRQV